MSELTLLHSTAATGRCTTKAAESGGLHRTGSTTALQLSTFGDKEGRGHAWLGAQNSAGKRTQAL